MGVILFIDLFRSTSGRADAASGRTQRVKNFLYQTSAIVVGMEKLFLEN
jgi:hypothetical protein